MKHLLLIFVVVFTQGCFMIPMGTKTSDDSNKAFMRYLEKREQKETPPMLKMDSAALLAMSPKQLNVFMKNIAEMQKNIPQNTDVSNTNTVNESETESTTTQKESILITALGSLLMVFVVILGVFWFKRTVAGKIVSAGANWIKGEIEDITEKMTRETDKVELKRLADAKSRLTDKLASQK